MPAEIRNGAAEAKFYHFECHDDEDDVMNGLFVAAVFHQDKITLYFQRYIALQKQLQNYSSSCKSQDAVVAGTFLKGGLNMTHDHKHDSLSLI